jgi:hypothetical protein
VKQRVTRDLFDYWDALRGARPAPDRADLDPGAIRACLAETFVLGFDPAGGHPFRIAGTAICTLFGRELTCVPFQTLWNPGDRRALADMVRRVVNDADGAVADITGRTAHNEAIDLEMILLPVTGTDQGTGRILGGLTATAIPYWLGMRPLQVLHLGAWHALKAVSRSALTNIAVPTAEPRMRWAGSERPGR